MVRFRHDVYRGDDHPPCISSGGLERLVAAAACCSAALKTPYASAWWRRVPLPDGHPMRAAVTQHPTQFIPCKWFADDGSLGKHRSLLAHHWSSLLTDGLSTADSRFPLLIFANHQVIADVNEVPLIKACIWSFKVLETGFFSCVDEHSNDLVGV